MQRFCASLLIDASISRIFREIFLLNKVQFFRSGFMLKDTVAFALHIENMMRETLGVSKDETVEEEEDLPEGEEADEDEEGEEEEEDDDEQVAEEETIDDEDSQTKDEL